MRDGALLMCFEGPHHLEGLIKNTDMAIAAAKKEIV